MFSLQLFIIMFDFNNFILCCDLFEYDILLITYKVFVSRKMFSLLVLGVVLNYVTLFFLFFIYDFNAQNYISPAHTFFSRYHLHPEIKIKPFTNNPYLLN